VELQRRRFEKGLGGTQSKQKHIFLLIRGTATTLTVHLILSAHLCLLGGVPSDLAESSCAYLCLLQALECGNAMSFFRCFERMPRICSHMV
jgi:hypothetical protein